MKRLTLLAGLAMVLALVAFAAPASAAVAPITQTPYTAGERYVAGSQLELSWESVGLPPEARLTLYLASSAGGGGLMSQQVETNLDQNGYTSVTVPTSGGPYFYYLESRVSTGDGGADVYYSDAYYAHMNGSGWWFTLGTAPDVTQDPWGWSIPEGLTATFNAAASGVPEPTCQWQVDKGDGYGFVDIDGATSPSYTTPATTASMNGWHYQAVFTNEYGSATTLAALLTVETPIIMQYPALGGATYYQGAPLTLSWESEGLDPNVRLYLCLDYSEGDGSGDGWIIASDLPQSGSYTVAIPDPALTRKYTYYLCTELIEGGAAGIFSNQFGQWFDVLPARAVTISAPWTLSAPLRARRDASFVATVTPVAASVDTTFALNLWHYETRRVDGKRVADWYAYPSAALSELEAGRVGGTVKIPQRGEWRASVSCLSGSGYLASESEYSYFTVR